jgi:hypothetical protein
VSGMWRVYSRQFTVLITGKGEKINYFALGAFTDTAARKR